MPNIAIDWLPIAFMILMGLSFLIYAVLDGYDLGVGVLLPLENQEQKDMMIYSIGPFWDANETWLVLAIGLLLIAFPHAHSAIFQALYLPTSVMLAGLILRGVSFDFRSKAPAREKPRWDKAFKFGSLLATLTQGYMLGRFVTSFDDSWLAYGFSILAAICVTAGYCFVGAAWLVMKTEGALQKRAAKWATTANILMAVGIIAVCATNLMINEAIMDKWFNGLPILLVLPIAVLFTFIFVTVHIYLRRVPMENDIGCWYPFIAATIVFIICFCGLGFSFYPYIVPFEMTIFEAASARESLWVIFIGAVVVLPMIIGYTIFSYKVFWGKTTRLQY